MIGKQAAELRATLVLTHLIPEPTNDDERRAFEDDIRAGGFTGALTAGNELDTVTLGEARRRVHVLRLRVSFG